MNSSLSLHAGMCVAGLALLASTMFGTITAQEAGAAKGLVIHKHSPSGSDKLADATEYLSVERFPQVTNISPVGGGPQMRILNDRVAEVIEYTDLTGGTITTDAQIAELKAKPAALGVLAQKYPKAHDLLANEARRINAAVQMLGQGKVLVAGQWRDKAEMSKASNATGEALTVTTEDGQSRTFTSVKITGQTPDSLQIMHSGGAASIPFEQLSEADRKKFGFDPEKAAQFRAEKEKMASTLPSPSASLASPVVEETEEEMTARLKREFPEKSDLDIFEMVGELKAKREQAATKARMADEFPSFQKLISSLEPGASARPANADTFNRFQELLLEAAPPSGRSAILKKGGLYTVTDAYGTFVMGQRTEDLILGIDIDGKPFALLQLASPDLLDGVKFVNNPGTVWCVGQYSGDREVIMASGAAETFPVFEGRLIAGMGVGDQLVTVLFGKEEEE
ncbi:MAG: hypothetical protein KDN19_18470 [Verrucomicrobiae bacterium]|nr:hypothetical protein [Verrucomicrobiae bacterium]